jgi:hypothetical protein
VTPSISVRRLDRLELLDAGGDHLGQAASPGSAPVEATDELPVHQDVVALGDRPQDPLPHVLVPDRDGEGGDASPLPERRVGAR